MNPRYSFSELIQLYFRSQGITQAEVARRLNVSPGLVNAHFLGRKNFGRKAAEQWEEAFGLSRIWLLTSGLGSMLTKEQEAYLRAENPDVLEVLGIDCRSDVTRSNVKYLGNAYGVTSVDPEVMMVDYVPVSATATFVGSLQGDDMELDKIPIIPTRDERLAGGAIKVFEVDGDSMTPTVPDKAQIVTQELPPEKWHSAKGVVVAVYDDMVVVKRVAKNALANDNYILLSSDNPLYGEMKIPLSALRGLFSAKRIISSRLI